MISELSHLRTLGRLLTGLLLALLAAGAAAASEPGTPWTLSALAEKPFWRSRTVEGEILFGAGHEYHDMQTLVTYRHKAVQWPGVFPEFQHSRLPRSLVRLKAQGPLKIALLGDSISTGCNARRSHFGLAEDARAKTRLGSDGQRGQPPQRLRPPPVRAGFVGPADPTRQMNWATASLHLYPVVTHV